MSHFNRKRIPVSDLEVGMHVCEVDRPWMELPFEPPFQIQGFRVRSFGEIEKIRRHCRHVYIDTAYSATKSLESGKQKSSIAAFLSRINPLSGFGKTLGSAAGGNTANTKTATPGTIDPPDWPSDSARRGSVSDYHKLFYAEDNGKQKLPLNYGILAPNAPERNFYQDQTTLEEEYEPAQLAIDDANSFYNDLIGEVRNDKELEISSLHKKVDAMARSIIRNPDALSYLVHLKSISKQTYNLAISSSVLAMAFGRFLGLSDTEIRKLGIGALLQDVGMVKLPKEMLNKNGSLTGTEYKMVQRHVTLSKKIVQRISGIPMEVVDVCYYHHERFDGSGYPQGVKGDQIPLLAMITGIVDTYMALVSFRSYRRSRTSYEALCELTALKNKQFVGALVDRFIQNIAIFPVGSFVQLNSGHVGIVVARNPMRFLEPKVMLILDPRGDKIDQTMTINFAAENKSGFFQGLRISGEVVPSDFGLDAEDFFV